MISAAASPSDGERKDAITAHTPLSITRTLPHKVLENVPLDIVAQVANVDTAFSLMGSEMVRWQGSMSVTSAVAIAVEYSSLDPPCSSKAWGWYQCGAAIQLTLDREAASAGFCCCCCCCCCWPSPLVSIC